MSTERAAPTFAQLLDFLEGRADADQRQSIEQLIESKDESVMHTIEWLTNFLRFSRENPVPAIPPLVRQRLRQSFERHHGRLGAAEEQHAELTFDSRTNKILVGVRGRIDDDGGTFQLAYSAPSADVLLDVIPVGEGTVRLEGQVLAAANEAAVWESSVDHPNGTIRSVNGDELGCFTLDDVPSNATTLRLSNGRIVIEAPLSHRGTGSNRLVLE